MKLLDLQQSYKLKRLIRHFIQWKWLFIALIVGTVLNLINQWEALSGYQALDFNKLTITYLVPYLVSSISGWTMRTDK